MEMTFGGHAELEGKVSFSMALVNLLQEGDSFQGLKVGSCLTLRIKLSKETHVLIKQEMLLGRGAWVESSRVREPGRTAVTWLEPRVLW